ncbi:MAG: hypothetical protein KKF27_21845 [Gammaproteobacteria bacterium]|nr:hypothetical protein [Gammaproteobacteria bacterium]
MASAKSTFVHAGIWFGRPTRLVWFEQDENKNAEPAFDWLCFDGTNMDATLTRFVMRVGSLDQLWIALDAPHLDNFLFTVRMLRLSRMSGQSFDKVFSSAAMQEDDLLKDVWYEFNEVMFRKVFWWFRSHMIPITLVGRRTWQRYHGLWQRFEPSFTGERWRIEHAMEMQKYVDADMRLAPAILLAVYFRDRKEMYIEPTDEKEPFHVLARSGKKFRKPRKKKAPEGKRANQRLNILK